MNICHSIKELPFLNKGLETLYINVQVSVNVFIKFCIITDDKWLKSYHENFEVNDFEDPAFSIRI